MKKYLWYVPIALVYYLVLFAMIFSVKIDDLFTKKGTVKFGSIFFDGCLILFVVCYIIGIIKLFADKRFDANAASKVAVFVKVPQLLPAFLLTIYSLIILIVPIGIVMSIAVWFFMAIVSFLSSVIVMLACIKAGIEKRIGIVLTIILGIVCYFPVIQYIVPFILLTSTKRTTDYYMNNSQNQYNQYNLNNQYNPNDQYALNNQYNLSNQYNPNDQYKY